MGVLIPLLYFKKSNLFILFFSVIIILIVLIGTADSFVHSRVSKTLDSYTIKSGATFDSILRDMDVNLAGIILIKIYIKKQQIELFQAGHYDLANKSWKEFINDLNIGAIQKFQIQIPAGSNIFQIKELLLNSDFHLDCFNFECLNKKLGFIEGTLMSDTYFYTYKSPVSNILIQSQNSFFDIADKLWAQKSKNNSLISLSDALILASIVEKEAGNELEKFTIAGVFLHRLKLGMRLQADPTIIYGLMPDFNGDITKSNIKDKTNPYNTYQIKGLPPSPISTISKSSLKAVILGEPNDYLYFVAKGDGTHYFSKNYKDHLAAVKKYQLQKK